MLDSLIAKQHIEKRLAQHARGIDRADELLLKEAYHDDGTVDYGVFAGSAAEFAGFLTPVQASAPISLHRPSNTWCKVSGDRAVTESYVIAYVVMPTTGDAQPHLVGGRYLDQHSHKNGEWRMQHRQYILDWCIQYPPAGQQDTPPAFALVGAPPRGGHHTADAGNTLLMAYAATKKPQQESNAMATDTAIDHALSHQAITELNYRYCRGADRGDVETLLSAFHDDAVVMSGVFNGCAREFADTVLPAISGMCTAHTVTNHWIEIDGDAAVGESYVMAFQGIPGDSPEDRLIGGRYIDRYERRDGEWKIAERSFVMDWAMSEDSKDLLNAGMFEAMNKGCRGDQDPVYALWNSLNG
ncbi:conserved hypothetical protein [Luminiphilus syltensis NOR5-1B]|uniref:SnoaL-like domain-containing protein n=1 Tax=Luminiphilus syltensis NOR5-1B TaxID=565045 RepID=B8KSQ8_9GAMM|nr:nuclear transport factor 2 family protein [Luminiphilus syltensis]EED34281.1 conserved hypothetical protein [Luminiphilus syltensis NOR5-1B]